MKGVEMKFDKVLDPSEDEWIDINEQSPGVEDDFETMMENQQSSKKVLIKLKGGAYDKDTGNDWTQAYYVVYNGSPYWSLSPCADSHYYNIKLADLWQYAKSIKRNFNIGRE